jgi:hypothetical protein
MWVLYHVKILGFGHFHLYDTDGSASNYIRRILKEPFFTYTNHWAPTKSMGEIGFTHPGCAETYAYNECIWKNRGLTEWVMIIHAPDNYVRDLAGLPSLVRELDNLPLSIGSALVPTYMFGMSSNVSSIKESKTQKISATNIFSEFISRRCQLNDQYRFLPIVDPHTIFAIFVHEVYDIFSVGISPVLKNVSAAHYFSLFRNRDPDLIPFPKPFGNDFCLDTEMLFYTKNLYEIEY